jgi:hypothetical protein
VKTMAEEITIAVRLEPEHAAALLRFLRSVAQEDIARTLDTPERVKAFEQASEKLRVALRAAIGAEG